MRYVPLRKVEAGMRLGEDLYHGGGRLLLAKRTILTEDLLNELKRWDYPGIYVQDELSDNVKIEQVIKPEIKREAMSLFHRMYLCSGESDTPEDEIVRLAEKIVTGVLDNKEVMCNMIDIKSYDGYTYFHCINVSIMSVVIGIGCELPEDRLTGLAIAAILHDVGKRFINVDVIQAKRNLTNEEFELVKKHPQFGCDFLSKSYRFSPAIYNGMLQHHERYDGKGYPLGTKGRQIPLYARIIKLADVYDALTSKRPYHDAWKPSEAVEYVMAMGGTEFDPALVTIFLSRVAVYPIGVEVILSDGRHAIVMKNHPELSLRPTVKMMESGAVIDLMTNRSYCNVTIVDTVI